MAMNLWKCDHPGCDSKVMGVGTAWGLLAIGWWFRPGSHIFCPIHRPDKDAINKQHHCGVNGACSFCTAERTAKQLQDRISADPVYGAGDVPELITIS